MQQDTVYKRKEVDSAGAKYGMPLMPFVVKRLTMSFKLSDTHDHDHSVTGQGHTA